MVINQGDVWWADIPAPRGSEPGYRRPVVVIQGDHLNASNLATIVCVPLTSNLKWAAAPGNLRLSKSSTGLPKESVANGSAITALDKRILTERVGRLSRAKLNLILSNIDVVLGRPIK
jgi:mRNA interferase MazF